MSKKRNIQRAEKTNAGRGAETQPTATATRDAFSIVIAFDPRNPSLARLNIMPVGVDGRGGAHIDDVVTALRLGYEQALMQKGAILFQQQLAQAQAQTEASQAKG